MSNPTEAFALTTIDNPYHPVEEFKEWLQYDMTNGYNTCGLLDRIAHTSDALTESENDAEIMRAIDEIIAKDPQNIYKKVKI